MAVRMIPLGTIIASIMHLIKHTKPTHVHIVGGGWWLLKAGEFGKEREKVGGWCGNREDYAKWENSRCEMMILE